MYRRAAVLNYFADGVTSMRDENQIDGNKTILNLFKAGEIPKVCCTYTIYGIVLLENKMYKYVYMYIQIRYLGIWRY